MKLFLLCVLVAVAVAQDEKDAEILRNDFQLNDDGSFQADMETSNQILQSASGVSYPGPEPETGSYSMSGQYEFTTPEGQRVVVVWTADENGYKAESDAIPKLSDEQQAAFDAAAAAAPPPAAEEAL